MSILEPAFRKKRKADRSGKKNKNPEKDFLNIFNQLARYRRPLDIWRDFVVMFACAISNAVDKEHSKEREKLYLNTINKYGKANQDLFPELCAYTVMALDENPDQDFLGKLYMQLDLGNTDAQQYFTPYDVARMMSSIALGDIDKKVKEEGYVTISDPCCGSGANLISAVNEARRKLEKENLNFQNHIFMAAQDIDLTVALMCYIQLSLLGVAAYIKVGNTLTDPMTENDSLENYWFTPMNFTRVWAVRRMLKEVK